MSSRTTGYSRPIPREMLSSACDTLDARMRAGFVHEATVELAAGADERAPGGAVTTALCGSWEHDGECRVPHHTAVDERRARSLRVRVVFACDPNDEPEVRRRVVAALATGELAGPDGSSSNWQLVDQRKDDLRADEATRSARWHLP
jgi:hypothetical protein